MDLTLACFAFEGIRGGVGGGEKPSPGFRAGVLQGGRGVAFPGYKCIRSPWERGREGEGEGDGADLRACAP